MNELEGRETTHDLVRAALAGQRLPFTNEKRTQLAIADALTDAGLTFAREVRLEGPGVWKGDVEPLGTIDFLIGSLGLEVKLSGSAPAVHRQLAAYARSERIGSLMLVTARAFALPPLIGGKPCTIFFMGRAWL